MNDFSFKVGDKVYCPSISSEILTIKVVPSDVMVFDVTHSISRNDCGFVSYLNNGAIVRLNNGCCMKTHCQKIVHATQENYELLSKLYPNVTFEPPQKRKEPIEIILAMIDADWGYIPCRVGDDKGDFDYVDLINGIILTNAPSYIGSKEWKFAVPFDPKSNKNIVDFVDGKIVLKD